MVAGDITSQLRTASDFKAACFDGVDDKVTATVTDLPTDKFAISLWVNLPIISTQTDDFPNIIDIASNDFTIYISKAASKFVTKVDFVTDVDYDAAVGSALTNGLWYHIVMQYTGSALQFYTNNVSVLNTAKTGLLTMSTSSVAFGNGVSSTAPTNCILRDIQFFNKELSTTQITSLYNGEDVTDGLIHRWKLQDDYNDSVGTAHGTNSGTFLTNTLSNNLTADMKGLNLAAVTDKLIVVPTTGRDQVIKIIKAERAAA